MHATELLRGIGGGTAVLLAQSLPNCNCHADEGGFYDCPAREGYIKYCFPNPPDTRFCVVVYDAYSGTCSFLKNKSCNGRCAYEANQNAGCSSCDESPTCCSSGSCQGTWDPNLLYCNTSSPLMISLEQNGSYRLTSPADGVWFDISASGALSRVSWTRTSSQVGFLALDRNGNGTIDDGSELFGTETPSPSGATTTNGFLALFEVDGGRYVSDLQIDATDPVYEQLRLWIDANHNGLSETEELRTLVQAGVEVIYLDHSYSGQTDGHGNRYKYQGNALLRRRDGTAVLRRMVDVFLALER